MSRVCVAINSVVTFGIEFHFLHEQCKFVSHFLSIHPSIHREEREQFLVGVFSLEMWKEGDDVVGLN